MADHSENPASSGRLLSFRATDGECSTRLLELERAVASMKAGDPDDDEAMYFLIDKHGGRNTYAAILQHALPEGMVLAHDEGAELSLYSVQGLRRPMRLTFEPRADCSCAASW